MISNFSRFLLSIFILLPFYYEPLLGQMDSLQQNTKQQNATNKNNFKRFHNEPEEKASTIDLYIKSCFELYHFTVLDDEKNDKSNHDYTGRNNKMDYSFNPVYLASFDVYAAWNIFQLEGTYKTNRMIKGGGTIEKGSDAVSTITDDAEVSEVLGLGIQIFNLHTSFRTVHFNFGKADVVDVTNNSTVESQDLVLKVNEADIHYRSNFFTSEMSGVLFRSRFFAGYRYMQYSLPRIVYTFRDAEETDQTDMDYVYVDETDPQQIPFKLHMAGYGFETTVYEHDSNLQFTNELAFFFGAGNTKFKTRNNGELKNRFISSIQFHLKPGLSYKLSKGVIKSSFKMEYELNLLIPNPVDFSKSNNSYSFGQADLYHGLFLGFDLLF
ncbi:MAG: hypothetical protein JXK07_01790 [Spirochaetes bacterium]|nr:hypothetical protein [Spirochaetota bacterium]MBN2770743.1 hypothetical protein [Spirochaetota bacterium]